ncbi:sn-glycerol-3-phosphate ABC transport system permease protein UgpA [Clostridium aceticum]|uniref:sn-glycerol-3-phosphate ABC transport system permease protein UgpA n=1 Tax=Clostridium aceticum TaxID=84022 RepID=A0A0D8IDZ8_9CLOT|nr:sugar ABC transporter permease [Clostridium aceticum]AKL96423.1 sn-glycerol-3-phosphate ABC transport system permease protein UgpA [Clostridium aceticum]KJF27401.1 ABC transporter permease [Clostridium aceticum]
MVLWDKLKPYFMVGPAIGLFLTFFMYPIGYLFFLSFTSWNLISPKKEFVGFENYYELLQAQQFHTILRNTTVYTFLMVTISISLALVLALWLNKKGFFYNFAQGAIFTPHIISLVSVSLVWLWIMDPDYGLLNWVLGLVGLPPSKWIASPDTALSSLVLVGVWKTLGYNTLVLLAGLQSIPKDIYEAATLDRASRWATLCKITLPMLSPTLFFLLVITTIASFKVFDTINIMTQGGPIDATNMIVFFIYQNAFDFFRIGYASAAGMLLVILIGTLTFLHFRLLARRVHYK